MTKHATKIAGLTASLLALLATASADVKLNDNITVGGYAVGSYQYQNTKFFSPTPSVSTDSLNVDVAKTVLTANFKPVTAVGSLFYVPSNNGVTNETTILDAYVTYDAGSGVTITGGKFLSWLGYEAFDPVNMMQITYANPLLGAIPAYHTGVKLEYSDKDFGGGVALVDSEYSGYGPTKGDGELKHNAGFEAYVVYKGVSDLTLWAGYGYDSKNNQSLTPGSHEVSTFDFWAQYQATKMVMVAAEIAAKDGGPGNKGTQWLALANVAFTDKFSTEFRVGGDKFSGSGAPKDTRYTVAPSFAVTPNLTIRGEITETTYKNLAPVDNTTFYGVQVLFKF